MLLGIFEEKVNTGISPFKQGVIFLWKQSIMNIKSTMQNINRDSRGLSSIGLVFLIPFHWEYRCLEEK